MTDEDMFETMDRILGGKEFADNQAYRDIPSSKPSHPLWKLIDQWGGKIYLKASQLELWEGES